MSMDKEKAILFLENAYEGYMDEEGMVRVVTSSDSENNFNCKAGMSKVCVILEDSVLKKSLYGIFEDNTFEKFFTENEQNYAKVEWRVYQKAVESGLEYFFAKTEQVANDVYEQEKADSFVENTYELYENATCSFVKKYGEKPRAYAEENGLEGLWAECSAVVFQLLLEQYSLDELLKLQEFLRKYEINDLHSGNWGYFNGKLKLFDFSGFDTDTENILNSVGD